MSYGGNIMKHSLLKKIMVPFLALFVFGSFSTLAVAGGNEESLYTRLGGTYNIAITVDHLVDKLYTTVV